MNLSQLDPNLVLTLGSLLIAGATALYHKIKGDHHDDVEDALGGIVEGYVIKLAESDDTIDTIRAKLTTAAQEGIARLGVKRNAAIDFIVGKLVDQGVTEVRKRVLARKQLESAVNDLASKAGSVTTTVPATSTVPKIGAGLEGEIQVTVVQP